MLQEKKKAQSPFGGDEEKSEDVKLVGPKKKPAPQKADVKGMIDSARKKKQVRSRCGCW
jgi:hypothetical protein